MKSIIHSPKSGTAFCGPKLSPRSSPRSGITHAPAQGLVEPKSPRSWKRELDQNKVLNGDLETALYSAAVAQEGMMPREGRGLTNIKWLPGCKH